jgi:hypothetical protein
MPLPAAQVLSMSAFSLTKVLQRLCVVLLGSDMAGEMAIMNPIVYDEPSYEDNELENTEVLSACVVTREMRTVAIAM